MCILIIFCLLCIESKAQRTDSIYCLPEVNIIDKKQYQNTTGLKLTTFDSIIKQKHINSSISDLLMENSSANIQSYGPGALSSLSIRGSSTSQTNVLWNEISLNSANIGMSDLSLLPVSFFDNIRILSGGASTQFGSGNIGGSLLLDNTPNFNNVKSGFISLSANSYHNYHGNISTCISNNKYYQATSLNGTFGLNTFNYINITKPEFPIEKQYNADYNSVGFMNNSALKLNSSQLLILNLWIADGARKIPSTLTSDTGRSEQKDRFYRGILSWKRIKNNSYQKLSLAIFDESLIYIDTLTNINSNIEMNIYKVTIEDGFIYKSIKLNLGLNLNLDQAKVKAYNELKFRKIGGVYSTLNYTPKNKKLALNLNLRQDINNLFMIPMVASFGFEFKLFKPLKLLGNVSKNYRIPTMNDLFWIPGGNTALRPENSWNEEISILAFKTIKQKFEFSAMLTAFNSNVSDWIIWMPTNKGYWAPENILNVCSKGFEMSSYAKLSSKSITTKLSFDLILNSATIENSGVNYNSYYKKQISYIPPQSAIINAYFEYKSINIDYNHKFSSYRFTTNDNLQYIPGFDVANLFLGKTFFQKSKKLQTLLSIGIENFTNTSYQIIQNRPMPLRSYKIKLCIKYK